MYRAVEIANFFLSKYGKTNEITPMKLIKLIYLAHAWHLGLKGTPLIDENPEAWKYGPVIPSVYHEYKYFGNKPITPSSQSHSVKSEIAMLLEKIWEQYGTYSGLELSSITHKPDSPWHITWKRAQESKTQSLQIPENLIQNYYQEKISKRKQSQAYEESR